MEKSLAGGRRSISFLDQEQGLLRASGLLASGFVSLQKCIRRLYLDISVKIAFYKYKLGRLISWDNQTLHHSLIRSPKDKHRAEALAEAGAYAGLQPTAACRQPCLFASA